MPNLEGSFNSRLGRLLRDCWLVELSREPLSTKFLAARAIFERTYLRPLFLSNLIAFVVCLFLARSVWIFSFVAISFFCGVVGSSLHPEKSAKELSEGPLLNDRRSSLSAIFESSTQQISVNEERAILRAGIYTFAIGGASIITFVISLQAVNLAPPELLIWGLLGFNFMLAIKSTRV